MFKESAKEFKNLRSLVTAALLIALHTVFAVFVSVQVTESLRISISFLINVVIGCLYGPVMGIACGAIGDIVQFVIKPTGPYFPGWTINAALACFFYGIFFYKKFPTKKLSAKNVEQSEQNLPKSRMLANSCLKCVSVIIPIITLALTAFTPFARIIDKTSGETLYEGNGVSYIFDMINNGVNSTTKNVVIICCMLVVLSIVIELLSFTKYNVVPFALTTIISFAALLAMYTDKKTTQPLVGFNITIMLLIIYIIIKIVAMELNNKVDMKFLIRTIIALTVDTVIVNILLGTWWVTIMYGKGFAFYFTSRLVKNLIQLPINITLTYYVLGFIRDIKGKVGLH